MIFKYLVISWFDAYELRGWYNAIPYEIDKYLLKSRLNAHEFRG